MSAIGATGARLTLAALGKLLRLAELVRIKHEADESSSGEARDAAEREVEDHLRSLSDEAKRDVLGLFYLGRSAGDDFNDLRMNVDVGLKVMPFFIAQKADLHDSLIKGLKRLGDELAGWPDSDGADNIPPNLDGVHLVQWSATQRAYYIASLSETLRSNFQSWLDGEASDCNPIVRCLSREEAHAIIKLLQKLRPEYEQRKEMTL